MLTTLSRKRARAIGTVSLMGLMLSLGLTVDGRAADLMVNSLNDSGPGTLRQAMEDAVAGDRIVFSPSLTGQTITLVTPLPAIDVSLTIDGSGAPGLNFAGAASDLVQSGTGTLTLQGGTLDFASVVMPDNGRLIVDGTLVGGVSISMGTLSGTGTINGNVTTGGTLTTGSPIGTLSFGSDLTVNGGTFEVDILGTSLLNAPPTHSDRYEVTNQATVTSGNLVVRSDPSNRYYEGTRYTFLTASLLSTDFDTVVDDLPFLNADVNANQGFFTLEADPSARFADFALDTNSLSVAEYLDLATSQGATQDVESILGEVQGATTRSIRSDLSQLGGEIYPALIAAQLQHTSFNLAMLRNQMVLNRSCYTDGNRAMGWVRGYGMSGEANDETQGLSGFDYRLGGTEIAVQRCFGEGLSAGAFGNFSWSEVELDGIPQRGQIDSYQFGGTLQHVGDYAYLFAIAGGGFQNYLVDRAINVGAVTGAPQAKYDGNQAFGYIEEGTVWVRHNYAFMPHLGLQYIYLDQEEFAESGGSVSLTGDAVDADSLRSVLGLSVEQTRGTGLGPATTRLRGGWMHEYFEPQQGLEASYSGATGTFTTQSLDLGRDWAVIGLNLQWSLRRNLSLLASYESQLNERQSFHTGAAGVEARW